MTVTIDRAALRRAFRDYEGPGFSIAFVTGEDSAVRPEHLESTVAAAIVAARESFPQVGERNEVLTTEPVTTPRGIVTFVDSCDSLEALDAWCDVVQSRLEDVGWSGKVGQVRDDNTPYEGADRQARGLAAALALPVPPVEERSLPKFQWHMEPALTGLVLDLASAYVLDGPGEIFFLQDLTQFRVGPGDAIRLLARAVMTVMPQARQQPPAALTRVAPDGAMARAYFSSHGHLHLESYHPTSDATTDWPADLAALTAQLRAFAPLAVNGLIRRSWLPTDWASLVTHYPPTPPALSEAHVHRLSRIESSRMPDAYGVQLLTDEHLAAAADLSRWHVEEVTEGRYLVIAPDLEAWFADNVPDPEVLARARADFAAMIVTADELATEREHDLAVRRAMEAGR